MTTNSSLIKSRIQTQKGTSLFRLCPSQPGKATKHQFLLSPEQVSQLENLTFLLTTLLPGIINNNL